MPDSGSKSPCRVELVEGDENVLQSTRLPKPEGGSGSTLDAMVVVS